MSTKSPFEIRLELLKMAQEYFIYTADTQQKILIDAFEVAHKAGELTFEEFSKNLPKTFSIEDVVAKAKEFYSFVDGKK